MILHYPAGWVISLNQFRHCPGKYCSHFTVVSVLALNFRLSLNLTFNTVIAINQLTWPECSDDWSYHSYNTVHTASSYVYTCATSPGPIPRTGAALTEKIVVQLHWPSHNRSPGLLKADCRCPWGPDQHQICEQGSFLPGYVALY